VQLYALFAVVLQFINSVSILTVDTNITTLPA